ncbi:MAG: hypothetical protein K0S71_2310 [Clostridia bacterium]|nr:hypothetical protein [Clostridia bacterium]
MKMKGVLLLSIALMIWNIFVNSIFGETIWTAEKMQEDQFFDQIPYIDINGQIMVLIRFISGELQAKAEWDTSAVLAADTKNEKALEIRYLFPPQGTFMVGESIPADMILQNNSSNKKEVWIKLSYKGPSGEEYELPAQNFTVLSNEMAKKEIDWMIPENIISGSYQVSAEVWDRQVEESEAVLLDKKTSSERFMIYHHMDEFENFNPELWKKTNHTLGRTVLNSKNVSVQDGKLHIHMPADVLEGGEVQSKELLGFGVYEIRMKLPTVPSSITGFFLYRSPDLHHEIDIEVYNEKKGKIFLTTYADGKKKNLYEGKVPFDLTEGYHNYKIEYYPERVAFYIDNFFITAWRKGFTKEKMYLIVNSWYPGWLKNIPAKETDSYLQIDWIRY